MLLRVIPMISWERSILPSLKNLSRHHERSWLCGAKKRQEPFFEGPSCLNSWAASSLNWEQSSWNVNSSWKESKHVVCLSLSSFNSLMSRWWDGLLIWSFRTNLSLFCLAAFCLSIPMISRVFWKQIKKKQWRHLSPAFSTFPVVFSDLRFSLLGAVDLQTQLGRNQSWKEETTFDTDQIQLWWHFKNFRDFIFNPLRLICSRSGFRSVWLECFEIYWTIFKGHHLRTHMVTCEVRTKLQPELEFQKPLQELRASAPLQPPQKLNEWNLQFFMGFFSQVPFISFS